MWIVLRNRKLASHKFLRQHPLAKQNIQGRKRFYIADFYCSKAKLVIEVDGGYHLRIKDEDANRDEVVKSLGLKTIRFTNEQVLNDLPKVLIIIEETLTPSNV